MSASTGGPPRLLLLIPTASYRVADFMNAAARLGVAVVVGTDRRPVLEAVSGGGAVVIDFADSDRGAAEIVALARERPFAAVVGSDDATALVAAKAAAALGLAHNPPEAIVASTDKYRQRRLMSAAGVAVPGFRRLELDDDPLAAARATRYPAVLKPLVLSASRGVIRVDDAESFVAAFARVAAILRGPDVATLGAPARHLLVEDFIPGREVALEALLIDGRLAPLALFDKPDPLDGPYFEETLYVTPSRLPAPLQARISATAAEAAAAIGLGEGPLHAELRIDDEGGVWLIELAARSIGGLCGRTLRFGAGVGLEEVILRRALGESTAPPAPEPGASGVMMIPIPRAGVLRAVSGEAAARAVPLIEDLRLMIAPGQRLVPLPEGNRYLGFLFARGDDPAAVEAALRAAHAYLDFEIEAG